MKKSSLSLFVVIIFAGCSSSSRSIDASDGLFQVGLYSELANGNFDGRLTIGELKKHGDFGLGTFDRLDGEMVVLDGIVYQVSAKGDVRRADDAATTPFAVITQFEPDRLDSLKKLSTLTRLQSVLDLFIPDAKFFYAILIHGKFQYMKTRSVPKQQKPYPALKEALAAQPIFEFENIEGTMVGFFSPSFAGGMNVAGYHFHFISDDRTRGGHVLECTLQQATIALDRTEQFTVQSP